MEISFSLLLFFNRNSPLSISDSETKFQNTKPAKDAEYFLFSVTSVYSIIHIYNCIRIESLGLKALNDLIAVQTAAGGDGPEFRFRNCGNKIHFNRSAISSTGTTSSFTIPFNSPSV